MPHPASSTASGAHGQGTLRSSKTKNDVTRGHVDPEIELELEDDVKGHAPPMTRYDRIVSLGSSVVGGLKTGLSWAIHPWRNIQRMVKAKESAGQGERALPWVAMVANCFIWLMYAVLTDNYVLMVVQSLGVALAGAYIKALWNVTHDEERKEDMRRELSFGIFVIVATYLYVILIVDSKDMASELGFIASVVCICMMASPLIELREVLRKKDASSMPLGFALFNTLTSILWIVAAISMRDVYLLFVNFLGLVLGLIQLVIIAMFGGRDKSRSTIVADILWPYSALYGITVQAGLPGQVSISHTHSNNGLTPPTSSPSTTTTPHTAPQTLTRDGEGGVCVEREHKRKGEIEIGQSVILGEGAELERGRVDSGRGMYRV